MDKNSKQALKIIKNRFKKTANGINSYDIAKEMGISINEGQAICNHLVKSEKIELEKGTQNYYIPSNSSLHPVALVRSACIDYLKDHWIAIIALIISIFSFLKTYEIIP